MKDASPATANIFKMGLRLGFILKLRVQPKTKMKILISTFRNIKENQPYRKLITWYTLTIYLCRSVRVKRHFFFLIFREESSERSTQVSVMKLGGVQIRWPLSYSIFCGIFFTQ